MLNQHYSIFIAQDNLDEVISGFSTLYFAIATHKVNICDHYFSLLSHQNSKKNNHVEREIIHLQKKNIEKIIQTALLLKNNKLEKSEDIIINLGKDASFTAIFSLCYP